jgi:hypothetical protein
MSPIEIVSRRAALASFAAVLPIYGQNNGHFVGELEFSETEAHGQVLFTLKKDFEYVDPKGVRWQAKAGLQTDGATIPRVFWPLVGHPYGGLYLRAAVIHDYYCVPQNRYRKWEAVHRVFYEGMLTNGVQPLQANLMYFAVWRFGPRWQVSEIKPCVSSSGNICHSMATRAYLVRSEQVREFDTKAETRRLGEIAHRMDTDRLSPEDIQKVEADLPSLPRIVSTQEIDANTDKGWYFRSPYEVPFVSLEK